MNNWFLVRLHIICLFA